MRTELVTTLKRQATELLSKPEKHRGKRVVSLSITHILSIWVSELESSPASISTS